MKHSFFGGVNPAARKENTRRKALSPLDTPPNQIILPLLKSQEGEAQPLVKAGDTVCLGQPVARISGGTSIHSSVSGRVTSLSEHPHPWGGIGTAIVIKNDFKNTTAAKPLFPPLAPNQVTISTLLERVRDCGIVGMGGGAYPTHQKLEECAGQVDTLIVNAAECEPYVTADYRLLLERSDRILRGAQTIARCLGATRIVLVTEGDKLMAVELMEKRMRKKRSTVELCTVRARYPLGAEKQIIQTVTGQETPVGHPTTDSKCIVLNVATVFAIQEALSSGTPLTHRAITVTGGAVPRPRNLWVPIGTPLNHALQSAGGLREPDALTLTGGPMMGIKQPTLDVPILKNTNALVCLTAREQRGELAEGVCIRCGKCVSACPMHLMPTLVNRALQRNELHRLPSLHTQDCIACGCCTYICPARIPLIERMHQAKQLTEKGDTP